MAPDVKPPASDKGGAKPVNDDDGLSAAKASQRARFLRKRTKTGCLTCRRRRIKCGEERPICHNCTKSKRHCEGYSQRLTFKPPTFDVRHVTNGGAQITFQAAPLPAAVAPYPQNDPQPLLQYGEPSHFRPPTVDHMPNRVHYTVPAFITQAQYGYGYPVAPQFMPHEQPPPGSSQIQQSFIPSTAPYPHPFPATSTSGHVEPMHEYHVPRVADSRPEVRSEYVAACPPHAIPNGYGAGLPSGQHITQTEYWHENPSAASAMQERPPSFSTLPESAPEDPNRLTTATRCVPRPELSHPIDYRPPPFAHSTAPEQHNGASVAVLHAGRTYSYPSPEYHDYDLQVPFSDSPNYFLNYAAVERQDDDYYDVNSDEEMDVDTTALVTTEYDRQRTLSGILYGHNISIADLQLRQYDTFINDGILDNYNLEEHANPLRNPATARVFLHFIAVTGPSLSIFERHPRNTSLLFTPGAIPFSQQGLWTYTMPMAALHHRGLLHAMLALASLHIARIQGASTTPSMLHYAWALKRVHHCVGHDKKRLKLTTIAASMLLGFYEVMAADHMKWNMHLAGSKQLFVEINFEEMMQQFRRLKLERASRNTTGGRRRRSDSQPGFSRDDLLDQIPDVDEQMISKLVGYEVHYGDKNHVMTPQSSIPPELDLLKLGMLKDLYWWFCKQDAYQSIVSGNPLLMEFHRWGNCPPRAPLGKADAVHGSFDHLMLLLGRIADFSSRDRARKLRQLALNGGSGRPSPSNNMPGPPPGHAPPTPQSANGASSATSHTINGPGPPPTGGGPAFFGMAPPPRQNVQMPNSFRPLHNYSQSHPKVSEGPGDLQAETRAALEEYARIRTALHEFASSLGDSFQPLTSEYQPEVATPFGPAVFYRSYDIGCLWAVYNMAVIIAIRSHPDMHPAAHAAAGMAAKDTEKFAIEIGRIVAGIVPGPPNQTLNPSLGAALCESCMPSFFAAIQYRDPLQRQFTVARISNISERTGWGSADLIANGIETAWVKAAAAGRGPPYTRMKMQPQSSDPRLNGSMAHVDMNSMPDETNDCDRRLVRIRPDARLNWAIGIMGTEEDELY